MSPQTQDRLKSYIGLRKTIHLRDIPTAWIIFEGYYNVVGMLYFQMTPKYIPSPKFLLEFCIYIQLPAEFPWDDTTNPHLSVREIKMEEVLFRLQKQDSRPLTCF